MILNDNHKKLKNGEGKCSVPMWMDGMPAGFCDEPAYGEQEKDQRRYGSYEPAWNNRWFNGYCGGLACYKHGGSKKPEKLIKEEEETANNKIHAYCMEVAFGSHGQG